nr:hypothetical protein [Armatimonadota bacterium]
FLDHKPNYLYKGKEEVEGSPCWKVESDDPKTASTIYWIDVDHGFLVRRMQAFVVLDGKLTLISEVRVPSILESNGVWVPAVHEFRYYWKVAQRAIAAKYGTHPEPVPAPGSKDEDQAKPVVAIDRLVISSFSANRDLPPDAFHLDWPVYTRIQNQISQKDYIIVAQELTMPGKPQGPGTATPGTGGSK